MLARTYHESQGKPIYVIRDLLGRRAGCVVWHRRAQARGRRHRPLQVELLRGCRRWRPTTFVVLVAPDGERTVALADIGAPNLALVAARRYSLAEHLEIGRVARADGSISLHVPLRPARERALSGGGHGARPDPLAAAEGALHAAYARLLLGLVRRRARVVLTPRARWQTTWCSSRGSPSMHPGDPRRRRRGAVRRRRGHGRRRRARHRAARAASRRPTAQRDQRSGPGPRPVARGVAQIDAAGPRRARLGPRRGARGGGAGRAARRRGAAAPASSPSAKLRALSRRSGGRSRRGSKASPPPGARAMAAGVPVVAARAGALPEWWRAGVLSCGLSCLPTPGAL